MKRMLLAAMLAALSAPVLAESLPRFDVERWCKQVASAGGNYSAMLDQGCFDMEQAAYTNLQAAWPGISGRMAKWCIEVARAGGPGSYSLLEGCIQMETEASGSVGGRQFKY
jgi:hypothetical protein